MIAATPGDDVIGSMFGPYRLDALLGSGGMGEVYRAYDTVQDRVVALKLLHGHLAADEVFQERFRRESRTTARLREPHVIPIHRFGDVDGRMFIDMRLVEGEHLAEVLVRRGRLSPAHAVGVVSQLARAVDAAHAEGLVHRDIKPSNVLCSAQADDTDSAFVYLVDFGIARSLESGGQPGLTSTGLVPGTVAYMAPERFSERDVSGSVDVYALACVLYECLTGSRPFDYRGLPALINAHLHTPPPLPSRHGVSAEFDSVIARGMAKEPEQRFATAGELAAAARAALPAGGAPPQSDTAPIDPEVTTPVPPMAAEPGRRRIDPGAVTLTSTSAGRRRVLRRVGLAAPIVVLVGAAAFAVLRPDTTVGTARAGDSSAAPADESAGVADLLGHLPTGFVAATCHAGPDLGTTGSFATVRCGSGPADGPNQVEIAAYRDEPTLSAAFESYADTHHVRPEYAGGDCPGGNVRHHYLLGSAPDAPMGGEVACYRDQQGAHLVWTTLDRLVLYIAHRADGDAPVLYQWWMTK